MFKKLHKLYENIGNKIKGWAMAMFVIEAIGAMITGFVFLISLGLEEAWWALFIIIFGPVVAWVSSWLLYAFGELVEDVHAIREKEGTTTEARARHEAEERAKREAEAKASLEAIESAKREAEERAKREAEAKASLEAIESAKRKAEESAKREAEERATAKTSERTRYEAEMKENKQEQTPVKKEKTLRDHLEYALKFQTDAGMIGYLKGIQDEAVQRILQSPEPSVREQINDLLSKM